MLEELLKHDKIGSREEFCFFLFDSLSAGNDHVLANVRKYCISNVFSISRCFNGLVRFFQFISFINIHDDRVSVNQTNFDKTRFDKETYFDQFHLYYHLIKKLKEEGILQELFNVNNLKFNSRLSQYYVIENRFPYKYFMFRNMLLSTGFFHRNEEVENHLIVKKEFTDDFKRIVIDNFPTPNKSIRKISLTQLKNSQQAKEDAGRRAELFALQYEHQRLFGHPDLKKVEIISEKHANAGYDIESFDDLDSIVFDRFVEIKSYEGEVSFYWSRNEVERAKELREKYYLYLVDRSRITEDDYKPQKLQDPYKKVFDNELWKKEITNWKITLGE